MPATLDAPAALLRPAVIDDPVEHDEAVETPEELSRLTSPVTIPDLELSGGGVGA